jgi:transcription factor S
MDWFSRSENEEQLRDLRFRFGYTKSFEQLEFLESIDNIKEMEECENIIELEKLEKYRIWKKRLEEKYGTGKNLEELAKLERDLLDRRREKEREYPQNQSHLKIFSENTQADFISQKLIQQQKILKSPKKKSMFCPYCKGLLIFSSGKLKCRKCGYVEKEQILSGKLFEKKIVLENNQSSCQHEIPIIQGSNEIKCPICGSFQHSDFGSRVIPNADYEDIRAAWLIQCKHCGHQWLYRYI